MKEPDLATDFDIIILGAGSDSQAAARQVRKRTERFLLINDGPYCTHHLCTGRLHAVQGADRGG